LETRPTLRLPFYEPQSADDFFGTWGEIAKFAGEHILFGGAGGLGAASKRLNLFVTAATAAQFPHSFNRHDLFLVSFRNWTKKPSISARHLSQRDRALARQ
jgi:hypothetical protein